MNQWYALYTKPRHEKKVHDLLLEKQFDVFLPLIKQTRRWKDRKKKVDMPLFSSYIFVNFDFKNRFDVLQTRGIVKIVNFSGEPAVVPQWQIDSLKKMLEFPESLQIETHISPGEIVEITEGPMRGMRGSVRRIKNEERLVLTIDGIMQTVSVEIETEIVTKVVTHVETEG